MPQPLPTTSGPKTRSKGSSGPQSTTRRLSELAKHLVLPSGIRSTGYPAVAAQCRKMGVSHDQWQADLGRGILAKRDGGQYAAGIGGILISICRQVGKTFTIGSIVFALCVLFPGIKVLWTAHHAATTDETFDTLSAMARRRRVAPYVRQITGGSGKQSIRFRNGSRIMFGAREHGFGRGIPGISIVVFDEAQILTGKALNDMVPGTNVAKNPLIIYMGTPPTPDDPKAEVFASRRAKMLEVAAARAVGQDAHSDALYVEVGADDDADPDDREQWAKANPSYPHRTPETAILRMRENLTDDESFLREGMGIWGAKSSARVIDEAEWESAKDVASMPLERLTLAIDVAPNRSVAALGFAGQRADGDWHVELDDQKKGTEWVGPAVLQLAEKNPLHAVVVDEVSGLVETKNGRHYLVGTNRMIRVTLAASEGRDMAIACGKFFDGVTAPTPTVHHTDQPQLNVALSVARKRPVSAGWAWNRKDPNSDITPVVAVTLALWGAQKNDVQRPLRRTEQRAGVVV